VYPKVRARRFLPLDQIEAAVFAGSPRLDSLPEALGDSCSFASAAGILPLTVACLIAEDNVNSINAASHGSKNLLSRIQLYSAGLDRPSGFSYFAARVQ